MKLKLILCSFVVAANTQAFVVTLQSDFDKAVTDSMGVLIPDGGGVIVTGFFTTLLDADIANSSSSVLGSDFVQFGSSGEFGFNGFGGVYSVAVDGGRIAPSSTFDLKTIYTVLGNGDTIAGSSDFVIFKHPFTFEADSLDANDKTALATLGEISGVYLLGGPVAGTVNIGGADLPIVQMAQAVPEPSALMLSALGAMALLRRKR